MHRTVLTALACAVLGATTGCGGNDEPTGSNAPAESPATTTQPRSEPEAAGRPEDASGGKEVVVEMKQIAFMPQKITVDVGQTVQWVNKDEADHNVESKAFRSETFGRGGTFDYKAERAGSFSYICTVHPFMKGTLVVEG